MKTKVFFAALVAATTLFTAACSKNDDNNNENVETITFSDLTLAANSYWNGSDNSGKFTSGIATLNNTFTDWGTSTSWSGFGYSNQNDTSTAIGELYTNGFSVYTATANTHGTFAVAYVSGYDSIPTIVFDEPVTLKNADFALNTYAYKSMKYGDGYGKQFTIGDWYKITITAYAANCNDLKLDVYLADFRDGKNVLIDSWTNFNLASLGAVSKLTFEASSTDNDATYGIKTPAYFCIDNIAYVK